MGDGVRRVSASGAWTTVTLVSISCKRNVTCSAEVKFLSHLSCYVLSQIPRPPSHTTCFYCLSSSVLLFCAVGAPLHWRGFYRLQADVASLPNLPYLGHPILVSHLSLVCSDPLCLGEATSPLHTHLEVEKQMIEFIYKATFFGYISIF